MSGCEIFCSLLRERGGCVNVLDAFNDCRPPLPSVWQRAQYLCKACGAHRVLQAKSSAIEPERKALILRAVEVERLGPRGQRVFGVARPTIANARKKVESPAVERAKCLECDGSHSFHLELRRPKANVRALR